MNEPGEMSLYLLLTILRTEGIVRHRVDLDYIAGLDCAENHACLYQRVERSQREGFFFPSLAHIPDSHL